MTAITLAKRINKKTRFFDSANIDKTNICPPRYQAISHLSHECITLVKRLLALLPVALATTFTILQIAPDRNLTSYQDSTALYGVSANQGNKTRNSLPEQTN